jgi:hypothetical protein
MTTNVCPRTKWEHGVNVCLQNIVSSADASLIAKNINIKLLDDLSYEERAKVSSNDQEKDYFCWKILEAGKGINITPTLIFQDCYPVYGSRNTMYAVNLKTGRPTAKSYNKTPLPPNICERLCNRTKDYLDYLKFLNPNL